MMPEVVSVVVVDKACCVIAKSGGVLYSGVVKIAFDRSFWRLFKLVGYELYPVDAFVGRYKPVELFGHLGHYFRKHGDVTPRRSMAS